MRVFLLLVCIDDPHRPWEMNVSAAMKRSDVPTHSLAGGWGRNVVALQSAVAKLWKVKGRRRSFQGELERAGQKRKKSVGVGRRPTNQGRIMREPARRGWKINRSKRREGRAPL